MIFFRCYFSIFTSFSFYFLSKRQILITLPSSNFDEKLGPFTSKMLFWVLLVASTQLFLVIFVEIFEAIRNSTWHLSDCLSLWLNSFSLSTQLVYVFLHKVLFLTKSFCFFTQINMVWRWEERRSIDFSKIFFFFFEEKKHDIRTHSIFTCDRPLRFEKK